MIIFVLKNSNKNIRLIINYKCLLKLELFKKKASFIIKKLSLMILLVKINSVFIIILSIYN